MSIKKFICVLLVLATLFSLCSCGGNGTSSESVGTADGVSGIDATPAEQRFGLLYCSKDSLNPYLATTKANQELGLLLFDSLFKLDNSFKLIYVVAEEYELKGKELTVTLKDNLKFSDASALSSGDIVFSFNEAKKSDNFKDTLVAVVSCTAVSGNKVKFTLNRQDEFAVNLLTFPIVKSGSTQIVDGDNVAVPPIGCGRYVYDSAQSALTVNSFYRSAAPNIKKIYLTNAPDNEVAEHNIKVGNSDIYYNSTAEEKTIRMTDSKRKYLNTTNLVYLGANLKSGVSANIYVRYAVSAALDRAAVAKQSYYSAAVPANGIFHPEFEPAKAYQTIPTSPKKEITVVNLEQIGYNKLDNDGYYVNKSGKRLKVSILVNSDNASRVAAAELIASSLKSAGIGATVKKVSFSAYSSALQKGEFEFYIGEVCLTPNMDISQLVYPDGSVAFGIPKAKGPDGNDTSSAPETEKEEDRNETQSDVSLSVWQILDRYYSGDATVADIVNIFESELPLIPICYRNASLFYNENFAQEPHGSVNDIYLGIEKYAFKY